MNSINELKAGKVAGPLAVKAANGNEAMRNDSVEPGTNGVANLEKKVNAEVEVKNEDVEMTEVPAAEAESAAVAPESQVGRTSRPHLICTADLSGSNTGYRDGLSRYIHI